MAGVQHWMPADPTHPEPWTQTVKHQGVYYFKNSWGTQNFGSRMKIGDTVYPGYGRIVQKYAHEFGQFYKLPVSKDWLKRECAPEAPARGLRSPGVRRPNS